jgi:hypothetical protein
LFVCSAKSRSRKVNLHLDKNCGMAHCEVRTTLAK